MSIPAGMLLEKYNEKAIMIAAFLVAAVGAFFFAIVPVYVVSIISLFLIGFGMAMLQVAINPLLRTAGGEEHFAFNSVFAQLFFGAASFLSPQLYSYHVSNLQRGNSNENVLLSTLTNLVPKELPWVSLYWIFAVVSILMIIIIAIIRLPKVELKEDERTVHGVQLKNYLKIKL